MSSDSPSPIPVPPEGKGPFEGKRWHEIWNPLNLDVTAKPVPSWSLLAIQLFCYMMWNLVSTNVGAFIPMLVLLGDPFDEPKKNWVYWILLFYLSLPFLQVAVSLYSSMTNSTGLTFFKVTLTIEYTREHKIWRVLTLLLSIVLFVLIIDANVEQAHFKECKESTGNLSSILNISITDAENLCVPPTIFLSAEAPKYGSLPFYLLLFSYFKSIYDLIFYNEIFHPFMVTSDEVVEWYKCAQPKFSDFVENRFPLHSKFAADNFKRDTEGEKKVVFSRTCFEPNIPIEPDESNWDCGLPKYLPFFWTHWIFTDANSVLKNILIACSRVSGYVNSNSTSGIKYEWTIEQLRKSVQDSSKFVSLMDDSVAWG
jgi:hypothetical protein